MVLATAYLSRFGHAAPVSVSRQVSSKCLSIRQVARPLTRKSLSSRLLETTTSCWTSERAFSSQSAGSASSPARGPVHKIVPAGDSKVRDVCLDCGFVAYKNPLVVAGALATTSDGKVLLCRRAIEPRRGTWTLPAGFMELGESVEDGALREASEEADVRCTSSGLLALYSVPAAGQVHVFVAATIDESYRATTATCRDDGKDDAAVTTTAGGAATGSGTFFGCGPESLESRVFALHEIPWADLAFPTVRQALLHHVRRAKQAGVGPLIPDVATIQERLPGPGEKLPLPADLA